MVQGEPGVSKKDDLDKDLESIKEKLSVGKTFALVSPDIVNFSTGSWAIVGDMTDQTEIIDFTSPVKLPKRSARDDMQFAVTLNRLIDKEDGEDKEEKERREERLGQVVFTTAVFGLKKACKVDSLPIVLLENLAVVYQKLGQEDAAFLHALAAWRISWIAPRERSAILAAAALHKRGRLLGAGKVVMRVRYAMLLVPSRAYPSYQRIA
jgi:hypothetical protein